MDDQLRRQLERVPCSSVSVKSDSHTASGFGLGRRLLVLTG